MVKFGPSGNSVSFHEVYGIKSTADSASVVANGFGLDCYEYSFGRGIMLGEKSAKEIGAAFSACGVELSVHAPYYVNFANEDREKIINSVRYVVDSVAMLKLMGGKRCVFHPASQGKAERGEARRRMVDNIRYLSDALDEAGLEDFLICPETMGKKGQMGTVAEVCELCNVDRRFAPCIDFGHINAREGGILKAEEDFVAVMREIDGLLPREKADAMHVHFSKIQYSSAGEIRHLTFEDEKYGPDYKPFIDMLCDMGRSAYVICESSGTQAEDARAMKEYYKLRKGGAV